MNMKTLKIIGIITMTLDHIGVYLVHSAPWHVILRSLGRVAYPLFAFMIAEGYAKTNNVKRYWLRLLGGSLITEACLAGYWIFSGENLMIRLDLFLPLFLGLSCLILWDTKRWALRLLIAPILFFAYWFEISYGLYGMLLILIFGWIKPWWGRLTAATVTGLLFISQPLYRLFGVYSPFADRIYGYWYQWFFMLAFVPLFFYNGQKGRFSKWFFYAYYPAHLLVLFLIGQWISL
ncbi:MAG TPA: TraX family protein [Bacillota bacterium]|nr:TraX family protein [Bacillota bacterium]